jgi:hypothetical protein
MKAKKTLTFIPLPLNSQNKEEKKSRCTLSLGAPFPRCTLSPSHNEFIKKITPFPSIPSPQ